jgi:acetylornithine deacetylase/succinyl-diaminopimelate desuccinylase-like protein
MPWEGLSIYNVGYIEGGTTVNSIPQEAVILYEYRSPSQKCLSAMEEKFNKIIFDFRSSGKRIKADILGIRPGKGEMNGELLKS